MARQLHNSLAVCDIPNVTEVVSTAGRCHRCGGMYSDGVHGSLVGGEVPDRVVLPDNFITESTRVFIILFHGLVALINFDEYIIVVDVLFVFFFLLSMCWL